MPSVPLPPIEQTTQDFASLIQPMVDLAIHSYDYRLPRQHTILEFGTDVGDSTRIWAMACRLFTGGHVTSVDIKGPKHQWWNPSVDYNITCITHDALTFDWAKPIDLLFIDDSHTYPHVLKELQRYGPLVRPGGVIVLHDICHESMGPAVKRSMQEWALPLQYPIQEIPVAHGLGVIPIPHGR